MIERIVSLAKSIRGWDQDDLEAKAGLARGRISKWKNGSGEPTVTQALTIAHLLGLTVEYLVGRDDLRPASYEELTADESRLLRAYRDFRSVDAITPEKAGLALAAAADRAKLIKLLGNDLIEEFPREAPPSLEPPAPLEQMPETPKRKGRKKASQ